MERSSSSMLLVLAILISFCGIHVRSDASDHRFKDGEAVPLYANKVGPFHNPRYLSIYRIEFRFFLSVSHLVVSVNFLVLFDLGLDLTRWGSIERGPVWMLVLCSNETSLSGSWINYVVVYLVIIVWVLNALVGGLCSKSYYYCYYCCCWILVDIWHVIILLFFILIVVIWRHNKWSMCEFVIISFL